MSMKVHANRILNDIEDELAAARSRKRDIEEAIEILANADISNDTLVQLRLELEVANEIFVELLIHRMLLRTGMRDHNWLDD